MATTTISGSVPALDFVEAQLNYLERPAAKPVNYAIEPPPGIPRRGGTYEPHFVRIHNGRKQAPAPTLDRNGFQCIHRPTRVSDFTEEAAIRTQYYREVEETLKEVTGASKVVIFDHQRRYALPGHSEPDVRDEVANRVHNDQTFASGPRRVYDHLPAEEAEARLKQRHRIINFWRPIEYPVETHPLALCDATSIAPEDLIPTDLVRENFVGETYSFSHSPRHRWFYFPELSPEEVLLLKIYDSRTDGTARLTAHTAFVDPTSAPKARRRRSIEVRTLVFWDD